MYTINFPVPLIVPAAMDQYSDDTVARATPPALRDTVDLVHFAIHMASGECSLQVPYLSTFDGVAKYLCMDQPRPNIVLLPDAHTWVKYDHVTLPWQDEWADHAKHPLIPERSRAERWDHEKYRFYTATFLNAFAPYYRGRARLFEGRVLCTAWTIVDAGEGTALSFALDSFIIWDNMAQIPYDKPELMARNASAWTNRVWRDAVIPFSRCESSLLKATLDTLASYGGELPNVITLH